MVTKTEAQLEQEWNAYVESTRVESKRIRAARPKARQVRIVVQSRHVTITNRKGDRLGEAVWDRLVTWNKFADNTRNLQAAISNARLLLQTRKIGTVVYLKSLVNGRPARSLIPIYEAKWGTDGIPFRQWKPNPVADRWRRTLAS